MITYIFRKRSATTFSIEKLFEALYAYFAQSGMSVRRVELPHVSTGIISVLRNTWFIARQRGVGLLHITGDVHYAALLRPFATTIITVHDCVVLQRGSGFKGFVLRSLWFSLPLRLASAVVVISEHTRQEVLRTVRIPAAKITVIPNFVDPALTFCDRPFSTHEPRILHVGTTANKNLSNVIAALRGIRCILVIVGPISRAVEAQIHECGIRHENLVGIDHALMARLYRESDIISFPSTYEGFGMPILEGQSVGRPVLTSDLEPMRGVAGVGGALLVDPQSVESIRQGFRALIDDAALRALLVHAGSENCRRYSLDTVAGRYRALYAALSDR
jgi:glycosyltransferase involved in cell wall biosynthesis